MTDAERIVELEAKLAEAESLYYGAESERARLERARNLAIEELGRANVRGNAAEAKLAKWIQALGQVHAVACPREEVDVDHPVAMAGAICQRMANHSTVAAVMLAALRQADAQIDSYLHGASPPQRDITLCKTICAAIAKGEKDNA